MMQELTASNEHATGEDVILQAKQITKVYDATVALNNVDFNIYRGKVNVLVGENGAGKSTLMKILAGAEQATGGTLLLDGKPVQFKSTRDAAQEGIGIIYQELNLFPNLSVAENIFMARERTQRGIVIDSKTQNAQTKELLTRLEQAIGPQELVGNLRVGQQQIVEIAKAIAQDIRILIMDEPTSALTNAEVEVLFRIINELREGGVSIIYISHKLDELLRIGDYVTILRDGHLVAEAPAQDIDVNWIVAKMIGRDLRDAYIRQPHTMGKELLKVEGLTLPRPEGGFILDSVSFSLRAGEILGFYGLLGAGRTELFESLMGLHPQCRGTISIEGKEVRKASITERIKLRLALIPEDRQREGLIQPLTVRDNMILSSLRKYLNGVYLSKKKERTSVAQLIKQLSIKVSNSEALITSLSGGNQQKVVIAKGLLTSPKVLLMDEPTRGIDIGAKADVFKLMNELAASGLGIVFISSELREVIGMADRILVMSKGRITGEFTHAEATEEALVAASAVGHARPSQNQGEKNHE